MATFQISVVIPDHFRVSVIRAKYDGSWDVAVSDSGGILGVMESGHHEDIQEAVNLACERAQPKWEEAKARWDASQEAAAARLARPVAAEGAIARRAAPPTGDGLRPAAAVVSGWAGSVPRNAAEWHVSKDGVLVILRPGLEFSDGSTERLFPTVRAAKDETRSALPIGSTNVQKTLF